MRILLLENNTKVVNTISTYFTNKNYNIDVVTTQKEALYYSKLRKYTLILINDKFLDTNIINNFKSNNEKANIVTIDDINLDKFLDELNNKIEDEKEKTVKIKDLIIDQESKLIRYNNIDIKLADIVFELFSYLAKNKNKIVSKNEIISALYTDPQTVSASVIDVMLKQIKNDIDKKLDIKTIKVVSYNEYMFVYGSD